MPDRHLDLINQTMTRKEEENRDRVSEQPRKCAKTSSDAPNDQRQIARGKTQDKDANDLV